MPPTSMITERASCSRTMKRKRMSPTTVSVQLRRMVKNAPNRVVGRGGA